MSSLGGRGQEHLSLAQQRLQLDRIRQDLPSGPVGLLSRAQGPAASGLSGKLLQEGGTLARPAHWAGQGQQHPAHASCVLKLGGSWGLKPSWGFFCLFIYLFIYGCVGFSLLGAGFSSCGERGLLFVAVCGLLIAVASLVAEHGL